jgi:GTP diphosphokinase / guanosine-3',5'-bis(diphosphate) 3'-diphosphatase
MRAEKTEIGTIAVDYLEKNEYESVTTAHNLLKKRLKDDVLLQQSMIMTETLVRWQVRVQGIVAAALLPLIVEGLITEKELSKHFDNRTIQTAHIAITHIFDKSEKGGTKKSSSQKQHAARLRSLFIDSYINVEAILVCVAHHLAQALRLDTLDKSQQRLWAHENLVLYLPLLEMLGMWDCRQDLGNLALALSDIPYYEQLEHRVSNYHEQHDNLFSEIKHSVSQIFTDININARIDLHYTTPMSLHLHKERAKLHQSRAYFNENSHLRVNVVLGTERECYLALGAIHNQWQPAHRNSDHASWRFHDYIATPHYNGYRCLITTVLCGVISSSKRKYSTALIEFRIVTDEMEQVNAYGIVAAMRNPLPIKSAWWTNLRLAEAINTNHHAKGKIAVFTPTGEVIFPVRQGSTMVDMAFKIHSFLGPYARRFWVNGRGVKHNHVVQHCDLIEIEYDMQYPSLQPDWMKHAKTQLARSNIKQFLKEQETSPHKGRELIDAIIKRETNIHKMRFSADKVEKALGKIAKGLHCPTLETLYMKVAESDISPDEVVALMIEDELVDHIILENGKRCPTNDIRIAQCWMQEKEAIKWNKTSRVMPGTKIVGRVMEKSKHKTLVVHRSDCRNAPVGEEAIALKWRATTTLREAAEITVTAPVRSGVTGEVLNSIYAFRSENEQEGILLHRFTSETQANNNTVIEFVVDAPSFEYLRKLQDALKELQEQAKIKNFSVWQLFPGQRMLISGRLDKRPHNPYTLRQIRDQGMFFGRDHEIDQVIQQINEGQKFIILYGQKRIGKTSLLHHLAENLLPQECDVLPVPFDAHSLAPFNTVSFLFGLAEATTPLLGNYLKQAEIKKELRIRENDLQSDPFGTFALWVRQVQKRLQGTKLLFMIDEFTRAEEEYDRDKLDAGFFDGMQWLAGNQNIGFILCVHDHIYNRDSYSWGMMQRGYPIRLDTLDYEAASRLVQQPLERIYKFERSLVNRILDLTNCHPYFLHAVCLELTARMSKLPQDEVTADDLGSAIIIVLRSGDHYFSHFCNATDDHSWSTLKTIAYIARGKDNRASREEIRKIMAEYGSSTKLWQISESLNKLYRAGIIEAHNIQNKISYSIPVGLFQFWLLQQTHPLISSELLETINHD